jgi:hypothetical protein
MSIEIYTLAPKRSLECAGSFLQRFLPNRKPASADYLVPELAGCPIHIFHDESGILGYLVDHETKGAGLYFNNISSESDVFQAMLPFTEDGGLILGPAVTRKAVPKYVALLKEFGGSQRFLVTEDGRPPETVSKFTAECESRAEWQQ